MNGRTFFLWSLGLSVLIVYLFASAPPPLPEQAGDANIPIARVFALVEAENDVVRALWTKEIVGAGKQTGLKFNENWREPGEDAGPLPALFLRATAMSLEKDPVRLSLFLGSDFPISPANRFQGLQQDKFKLIRETMAPQFFRMADTGLYTAMFPDEAVAEACVTCHNDHQDSPKHDWKLHDVMGATTWSYPEAKVSTDELIRIIAALHKGFREAYEAYLRKASTFRYPPEIGSRWPRDGYFLPSADAFMNEVMDRTARSTLEALLIAAGPEAESAPAQARETDHVSSPPPVQVPSRHP